MNKAQREFSKSAFANIDDYRELENYTLYTLRVILSNNRIGNAEKIRTMQEINRMSEDRQQQIAAENEPDGQTYIIMYDYIEADDSRTNGITEQLSNRFQLEKRYQTLRNDPNATNVETFEY